MFRLQNRFLLLLFVDPPSRSEQRRCRNGLFDWRRLTDFHSEHLVDQGVCDNDRMVMGYLLYVKDVFCLAGSLSIAQQVTASGRDFPIASWDQI